MNLSFKLITKGEMLADYQRQILDLFEECFKKTLTEKLWQWAFLENPCGEPIASLCFNENNKLIGHYAVIPLVLRNEKNAISVSLSMTTMVSLAYRKYGVFVEQANRVYEEAREQGIKLIIGFPNANSAPGFKKRLGWVINESTYITCVDKKQLINNVDFKNRLENQDAFDLDIHNKKLRQWRLSKPGAVYIDRGEVILKKFGQAYDLVYAGKGFSDQLAEGERYNILMDGTARDFKDGFLFDYQFGYKCISDSIADPLFKINMLMSDVF